MKKFLIGLALCFVLLSGSHSSALALMGWGGGAAAAGGITLETETATTSGTSHDYTGIPAGTQRITVMLVGVSTNGTSNYIIQLGDSGGIETTGYLGGTALASGGSGSAYNTGYLLSNGTAGDVINHGPVTLTLQDSVNNTWAVAVDVGRTSGDVATGGGSKTLSGVLTQLRLTTVNGTDAFDAGAFNIAYE